MDNGINWGRFMGRCGSVGEPGWWEVIRRCVGVERVEGVLGGSDLWSSEADPCGWKSLERNESISAKNEHHEPNVHNSVAKGMAFQNRLVQ